MLTKTHAPAKCVSTLNTKSSAPPTHFVMTLDEAIARRFHSNTTEADIAELPAVYPQGWTLLDQLTTFFKHYKRPFPEAHTQDLPPTQSANEAKVYQLRTNRNPRATVYQFTDREITGLSQPPLPISAKNTYTANLPRFPSFSWKTTKIRSSQPSQKPFFRQLLFNNFNIYF